MDELKRVEYEALRATIRERGSVRIWSTLGGLAAWGGLSVALAAGGEAQRAVTLVPLLVLATTFEISFFVHTGVERVGRYLQIYYDDLWEETAMSYGRSFPGVGDPLFVRLFATIAVVNFLIAAAAATLRPGWIGIGLVAHLMLGWRLHSARASASNQRAVDLERFRSLKNPPASN